MNLKWLKTKSSTLLVSFYKLYFIEKDEGARNDTDRVNKPEVKRTTFAQNIMYRKQLREIQKDHLKAMALSKVRSSENNNEDIRKTLRSTFLIHELEENQATLVCSPSYEQIINLSSVQSNNQSTAKRLPQIDKRYPNVESKESRSTLSKHQISPIYFDDCFDHDECINDIVKPKSNNDVNYNDTNSKSTWLRSNQSKFGTHSIKISSKIELKDLSDKRSTNISESIQQMKGDFISNAEINYRYLNQNKSPKTIEVHDQDRVLSYAHSKAHMSPVKIHGVNINKSSTMKRANRICNSLIADRL